jgi:NitT/TauT family transport system ATP-binding protein
MLTVDRLHHSYGPDHVAIASLTFKVNEGEIVAIVGPSGCGKTTLLKSLAGLLRISGGAIRLDGQLVSDVPKGLAVVFQEYGRSLLPWCTVEANVQLPLRYQSLPSDVSRRRIKDSLAAVGLLHVAGQYPWQLSGGMQQRVAIARALAYHPKLLLMDEPFASVDAQTRADLEDLVAEVRDRFDITIVLVTHDIDEAVYLSDRVLVLSASPSRLLADIPINVTRPRDQITTRASEQFLTVRSEVVRLIRRQAPPAS